MRKYSNKSKIIIILGPPGSGKGTQAQLLANQFDLYHLETSEIIERNLRNIKKTDSTVINRKKYFLWKEKKLRNSGKWMSPPLITFWVKSKIKALAKEGKGIVFSGSPKTLYEAKEIVPLLKKTYGVSNIRIIPIKQRAEVSVLRNSKRRICLLMRHPILYNKENAKLKLCPFDGSKLVLREDSKPEIIKSKLEEYKERTFPLIAYFKKQGLKVKEVNGERSVVAVFKDILRALK